MQPSLFSAQWFSGLIFLVMLATTVAGALIAVGSGRLIRSVAGLALCFIGVAGLFYYLHSPFVALMEILIYVGAVCVTIIFAVMLAEPQEQLRCQKENKLSGPIAFIAGALMVWGLAALGMTTAWRQPAARINQGTVEDIGQSLLTTYSMSFELISVVLLLAIIGSLVLARAGRSK